MKRTRTLLSIVLFSTFGLAACGGDGDDATDVASEQPDDADDSDDSDDSGDSGDSGSSEDTSDDASTDDLAEACADGEIPDGLEQFITGDACNYIACVFDDLGIDSLAEAQEKWGDDYEPSPAEMGQFAAAIQKCAPLVTGQS
jgi:hypothetical protein